jgi:hypothetical protein
MKSLDKIDFDDLSATYEGQFEGLVDKDCFELIQNEMKEKSQELKFYFDKNYKIVGVPLNRHPIEWGFKVIRGWHGEELIKEALKKNKSFKRIIPLGGDKTHTLVINHKKQEVRIQGNKSSTPDLLGELRGGNDLSIEIKLAAKGAFTVKKTNVDRLYKEAAHYNRIGIILMLDIVKGLYSIENLSYFYNKVPFPNHTQERQLCFKFPIPKTSIKKLLAEEFEKFIDPNIFHLPLVKHFKSIRIAETTKDLSNACTMKNKIKVEEHLKTIKELEATIADIHFSTPDITKPWEYWHENYNEMTEKPTKKPKEKPSKQKITIENHILQQGNLSEYQIHNTIKLAPY